MNLTVKNIYLFLFLLPFKAVGDISCNIPEHIEQDYSNEHASKITIETRLEESNYQVVIMLPTTIDKRALNTVFLVSDSLRNASSVIPLKTWREENQFMAWYIIDAGLTRRHFVSVQYGEGCEPSIFKEVFYQ